MKKFLAFVLCLSLMMSLAACGKDENNSASSSASSEAVSSQPSASVESSASSDASSEESTAAGDVDLKGLLAEIQNEVELPMPSEVDDETFELLYGIPASDVEEYAALFSMVNVKAMDIAIMKPKAGQEDAARTALENRKAAQEQAFEMYLEDQYEAAKNAEITEVGDYLVLVILSENADKVMEIIESKLA